MQFAQIRRRHLQLAQNSGRAGFKIKNFNIGKKIRYLRLNAHNNQKKKQLWARSATQVPQASPGDERGQEGVVAVTHRGQCPCCVGDALARELVCHTLHRPATVGSPRQQGGGGRAKRDYSVRPGMSPKLDPKDGWANVVCGQRFMGSGVGGKQLN